MITILLIFIKCKTLFLSIKVLLRLVLFHTNIEDDSPTIRNNVMATFFSRLIIFRFLANETSCCEDFR